MVDLGLGFEGRMGGRSECRRRGRASGLGADKVVHGTRFVSGDAVMRHKKRGWPMRGGGAERATPVGPVASAGLNGRRLDRDNSKCF